MSEPLVSIICLCFNQKRFVRETLDSAFGQSYGSIEIIVVDDGSTDGSKGEIGDYLTEYPEVHFTDIDQNVGNTRAFNQGLKLAKGKYIIDLSCDDILEPDRVEKQVAFFENQPDEVGVIYSDAQFISENGVLLNRHFDNPKRTPFVGEVYSEVVSTYFIPAPTMLMKKEVLDELGGYDEELAYEDFDFWVRSARKWKYAYQDEVLTKIRFVRGSHSHTLYKKGDRKLRSTIKVCQKVFTLNKNEEEQEALADRLKYEFRHAMLTGNKAEASEFLKMLKRIKTPGTLYSILGLINKLGMDFTWFRSTFVRRTY